MKPRIPMLWGIPPRGDNSASAVPNTKSMQKNCVVGSARLTISIRFFVGLRKDSRKGPPAGWRTHAGYLMTIQVHAIENRPIEAPMEHCGFGLV